MRRFLVLTVGVAAALSVCGCSNLETLSRARAIEREIEVDRLKFLERVSDAYFILGYEYYTLAAQAEDVNEPGRAREYATKASLYNLIYRDFRKTADELRAKLETEKPATPHQAPPPPPAQPAPAPGQ
ncbi:MAG TPA: hypothetical protein VM492_16535 [Sumerlaeia bacterium]|nr:hypothetical protein [Sumerlaeia bacterium]